MFFKCIHIVIYAFVFGHFLAGDSRAIIIGKDKSYVAMSDDHKPNRPDEMVRIEKAGGCVIFRGTWRVSSYPEGSFMYQF